MDSKMASSLSSSSSRETRSENHQSKKIGCMAGIFHLIHKHHNSQKRLTEKKNDKNVTNSKTTSKTKRPAEAEIPVEGNKEIIGLPGNSTATADIRRFSCDVPRSPTLPPEIRRSNSVNSPENFSRTPALVARLMGLEEIRLAPESANEKRRKLLGALEKCDEDLKALKKFIEGVRMEKDRRISLPVSGVEYRPKYRPSPRESVAGEARVKARASLGGRECFERDLDGGGATIEEKMHSEFNCEQPSPVSVLDEISSPLKYRSYTLRKGGRHKKLKDDDFSCPFFQRIMFEALPQFSCRKGNDPFGYFSPAAKKTRRRRLPFSRSRTMIESVNEVWKDGIREERWELGRIGVVLEGDIFGELVDEMVRELGWFYKCSLPMETCRKRLCF
ncbi:uncharacterized protein LOC143887467 [Tasmannia lanceolata]|uniref:uncharacterized protein LOC143887453 n=1 Tax=Tasmannia lanceolata TaxID=3420 RepID=UPI004062C884